MDSNIYYNNTWYTMTLAHGDTLVHRPVLYHTIRCIPCMVLYPWTSMYYIRPRRVPAIC